MPPRGKSRNKSPAAMKKGVVKAKRKSSNVRLTPKNTEKNTDTISTNVVSSLISSPKEKKRRLTSPRSPSPSKIKKTPLSPSNNTANQKQNKNIIRYFYASAIVALSLVAYCFVYVFPPLTSVNACKNLLFAEKNTTGVSSTGVLHLLRSGSSDPKILQAAYECGNEYGSKYSEFLAIGFCMLYVTMQSFVIPGTGMLSVLSGALFPLWQAELMVAACATIGATVSFILSGSIGNAFIEYFMLESKLDMFRKEIRENSGKGGRNLLAFMAVMRSTPMPNLLINVGSPHVGVPITTFFFSTLIGLVPLNTCHILSGKAIATVGTLEKGPLGAIFTVGTLLCIAMYFLYRKNKQKRK